MTVYNKILISCKTILLTGQQFVNLLPAIELLTDGLIFISSIFHVIVTSQCRSIIQILGRYCEHIMRVNTKILKKIKVYHKTVYRLASRTTAGLFDPRRDLLLSACGFGQQIRSRVKQNYCCPRTQSITVYCCTLAQHMKPTCYCYIRPTTKITINQLLDQCSELYELPIQDGPGLSGFPHTSHTCIGTCESKNGTGAGEGREFP